MHNRRMEARKKDGSCQKVVMSRGVGRHHNMPVRARSWADAKLGTVAVAESGGKVWRQVVVAMRMAKK